MGEIRSEVVGRLLEGDRREALDKGTGEKVVLRDSRGERGGTWAALGGLHVLAGWPVPRVLKKTVLWRA